MHRIVIATAVCIACGSEALAATLSVEADKATYRVGDTITLRVTGDTEGGFAVSVYGRLLFGNPSVAAISSGVPDQVSEGNLLLLGHNPWIVRPLHCGTAYCEMFHQLSQAGQNPVSATNLLIASVSFIALEVGISTVSWETDGSAGFQLDFFGLTNAVGTTIDVRPIPEPATAALLGLGICGLASTRRRRCAS